jgi:phage FluMu protein Com
MLAYKQTRCKDCDSMLWSMHAKSVCLCPDCENVDSDETKDLEERFEDAYN